VADHPAEGGCSPSATRRPLNVELLAQSRVESAAVVVAQRKSASALSSSAQRHFPTLSPGAPSAAACALSPSSSSGHIHRAGFRSGSRWL
jgi:hypothetical protein